MPTKFVTLKLGIKKNAIDGLLIYIPTGSNTAMITTKNRFAAAPVVISRKNIKSGIIKYIFINSGNANACTGKEGHNNAKQILNTLSKKLNCSSDQILIMSTGIIGRQLPIKKIIESISDPAVASKIFNLTLFLPIAFLINDSCSILFSRLNNLPLRKSKLKLSLSLIL